MATVTFRQACRVYPGVSRPAVDSLDLDIADGEFLVLVGPSGCGKSTSLRMLAGLEDVTTGSVFIGEREVTDLAPRDRDIAMVFQNYALYPHLTVRENMAFALKIAKHPSAAIERRVREAAELLGVTAFLDRKPKTLSGGQRQRVAMGRAIVRLPQVFLMDEPLSNLDAKLRTSTRAQIASLQKRLGVTTVYVTHDQVEAMTMGDRVAVLKDGRLQQCDTPTVLYQRPANAFVAGFIGSPAMNLIKVPILDNTATIGNQRIPLTHTELGRLGGADSVLVGFRPEAVRLAADGFKVSVRLVEDLGADAYLYGSLSGAERGTELNVAARIDAAAAPPVGETVHLNMAPDSHHLFAPDTGDRISD